jgi:transmembrane sensor
VVLAPERRLLEDGSVVELKPGAEIEVGYTGAARRVSLVRGEAHFEVAKNPDRPFIVRAGEIEVRAVGTAFAVQLATSQVEVLVTEGRVAVERSPVAPPVATPSSPDSLAPRPPTLVGAGARVVVAREPSAADRPVVSELSAAEIGDRLAWRAPRLEFTRTPLSEVLPLVNRHNRAQIRLADPALGQVRISGILRADNLDTLLQLLEDEYALRGEWRGQDEVVLRRSR